MTIRIGSLRHRVAIQSTSAAQTSTGSMKKSDWATIAGLDSVPAEIVALSGKEFMAAQSMNSKVSARITIRWCDVKPTYRINNNGVIYNIEAILPDAHSTREYLTIMVSTGVNQGG
jgi:SPP1 family predicted phage head-tail adaptor